MHLERRTLLKATLLRARVMLLAVFLSMLAILLKVIYLQYARGDSWKAIAASTQLEYKPILASRGNIYADDGSLLATSLPFYRVALDTTLLSDKILHQEIDLLCQKLADFYGDHPASYYKERIIHGRNTKRRYLLLNKRYITYEDKKAMLRWPIMDQGRYKGGIIFEEQYRRYNPFQTLAKRTIGSYREVHRTGLEHAFNSTLQGRDGQALYQKVVGGNWRLIAEQAMIPPIDGYDLETTLDVHLQDITESSLLSVLEKSSARNGCAVVMEVSTGAVKAIAHLTRTS